MTLGCGGTKLDCTALSPGCRICAEGGWSCLFISGRCNCRCFYCPTSHEEIGLPAPNTVEFRTPADYVAYLERFGFSGANEARWALTALAAQELRRVAGALVPSPAARRW